MKRTDRLMAILIALQQRAETAQSLADKLEVSKRTIFRDMEALAEMGVPLYALPGPAGGFRLMDGYRLPPLQLDAEEVLAVLFALNAMTKMADTPFNQARWTAIDKIRSILPSQLLQEVEPVLNHMEIQVPERSYKTPLLDELLKLTAAGTWLRVYYRSERHERWLTLLPRKVYTAHGYWYCDAFSVRHREERSFRVDRFVRMETAEAPSEDGQDMEVRPTERGEAGHSKQPIPIRASLTYRGALLTERDRHMGHLVRQVEEDRWELEFACPAEEYEWAVRHFFSLGQDAEVHQPAMLRADLCSRAEGLVRRYKDADQDLSASPAASIQP